MKNLYLRISKNENDKLKVISFDGVFARTASFGTKIEYCDYCQKIADEWVISELGNYDGWSKEDRLTVSDKWIKAKDLQEGDYEYYFNFSEGSEIFQEEVKELAQKMGINNYKLIVF